MSPRIFFASSAAGPLPCPSGQGRACPTPELCHDIEGCHFQCATGTAPARPAPPTNPTTAEKESAHMDPMTPTIWLLAALAAFLFVGLLALAAWRYGDKLFDDHYRTADGGVIDRESRQLLQQANSAISSRRVRAGQVPTSTAPSPDARPQHNLHQVRARAVRAAMHDMRHGNKRQPSPYTAGTAEHAEWWTAYNQAFPLPTPPAARPHGHLHAVNSAPVQAPAQPAAEQRA